MSIMFSDTFFTQDDAPGLQKALDNWDHPDPQTLLRFLDKAAEKPHTTACLLRFLHANFTQDDIDAQRRLYQEKRLGLLDLEEEDWLDEFRWEIIGGSARVLEYLGHDEDVRIPEILSGCPVRWIARSFFISAGSLRRLLVPEGIQIGQVFPHEAWAFLGKGLYSPEIIHLRRETPIPPHKEQVSRPLVIAKDHAVFGCYAVNRGEVQPIRWKVLQLEEKRILLLAEQVLDLLPYHGSRSAVLWPESDLRSWLNDCFLSAAFTPQERSLLLTAEQVGQPNPLFHTRDSSLSQDQIFLLQPEELASIPSEVPIWTRMPGLNTQFAVSVLPTGQVDYQGQLVNKPAGVRPALWVRL